MLRVTVPVRILVRRLILAIVILAALHLFTNFLEKVADLHGGVVEPLVHYFSMDEEVNVPTWFTVILLAVTGLVTGDLLHAEPDKGRRWAWGLIAFVLLYLSIDEMTSFHEHLGTSLEEHFSSIADLPFNGWVAFYGPLALVVAAVVVPSCGGCSESSPSHGSRRRPVRRRSGRLRGRGGPPRGPGLRPVDLRRAACGPRRGEPRDDRRPGLPRRRSALPDPARRPCCDSSARPGATLHP
ncbi:hypothetical protein NKG05_19915 [Oerskovia sp. M15]